MYTEQCTGDPAQTVAASLKEIHQIFETAEETYRCLRAEFLKEDTKAPIQWVPITNQ
jgi:hypothetical protein